MSGRIFNTVIPYVHLSAAVPENSSTGYLLIGTSGGLNQQRIGVQLYFNFLLRCFVLSIVLPLRSSVSR